MESLNSEVLRLTFCSFLQLRKARRSVLFFLQEVYQGTVTNLLLTELVFVLNLFCHFFLEKFLFVCVLLIIHSGIVFGASPDI